MKEAYSIQYCRLSNFQQWLHVFMLNILFLEVSKHCEQTPNKKVTSHKKGLKIYLPPLRWEQADHHREDATTKGDVWNADKQHCTKHIEEMCFDFFQEIEWQRCHPQRLYVEEIPRTVVRIQ